jgi:type IV secretory pathway VirB3-like protein
VDRGLCGHIGHDGTDKCPEHAGHAGQAGQRVAAVAFVPIVTVTVAVTVTVTHAVAVLLVAADTMVSVIFVWFFSAKRMVLVTVWAATSGRSESILSISMARMAFGKRWGLSGVETRHCIWSRTE